MTLRYAEHQSEDGFRTASLRHVVLDDKPAWRVIGEEYLPLAGTWHGSARTYATHARAQQAAEAWCRGEALP